MSFAPKSRIKETDRLMIRFWGVRGSIPTPGAATARYGGNTSCVEVRYNDQILILDSGTGIRGLGSALRQEFKKRPMQLTLLLTHTHWDHIQGFPFFQPAYQAKNRIEVVGAQGTRHGLAKLLTSQMESPFFPVGLRDLPSTITIKDLAQDTHFFAGLKLDAIRVNHPGQCVGFRMRTPTGTLGYFPDNELARKLESSNRIRLLDAKLAEFIRGLDLLIMDTQYTQREYPGHVGWGHGCLDDVVRLAAGAEVRHLVMFHHDPDHTDTMIDAMLRQARRLVRSLKSKMKISAAREGLTLKL